MDGDPFTYYSCRIKEQHLILFISQTIQGCQDNSDLCQFGPSQFGPYFIRPQSIRTLTLGQFGPRPLVNSDLFVMVNSDLIKYFSLVNSDLFHWSIRTLSVVNSDLFHWSIRTLPVVNSENFYWSVRTLLVVDSINLVKPNQSLWKIFPWNNNEKQLRNYLKKQQQYIYFYINIL